ncbi:MAG TPA: YkgJ family cysteine cluster protein [Terracidiphilus sp.]|nr:YkgJ family cysteine cluster protein [Terracidiphilus sp.]
MSLPARDRELVQIMDAALADAARRAGPWLVCRPGCTPCCHGAFAINALDAARLRAHMQALHAEDPGAAEAIQERARAWLAEFGPEFPGNPSTGILGISEGEQARFEDFASDAPCPALDPATGLCAVYEARPMTCRVFGPPVRMQQAQAEGLGCCELCFAGASEEEIAACEMPIPHALEEELLSELGASGETVVAFALLG